MRPLEATRAERWERLRTTEYDVLVVGGGITGAGVALEAARAGLSVALVEARDYAWGTSSRSSKMVHGGLRYLQQAQVHVTLESVRERERLMREAPGLVRPLGFLMAVYAEHRERRASYAAGLTVYDALARKRLHRYHDASAFGMLVPHLRREGLIGGFSYVDAQTDDARLTLRVLQDARAAGADVVNYVRVTGLAQRRGAVCGASVRDELSEAEVDVRARVVVNATGACTDALRREVSGAGVVRPLRGSHLVFPSSVFPVAQAVAFQHPLDGRNVFVHPWDGHVLVGTTDLDHDESLQREPRMTPHEASYLMAGVAYAFPGLPLDLRSATAAWAGVRAVVGSGKRDPSRESRDALLLSERGLVSVTGGKLTTFRATSRRVLKHITHLLGRPAHPARGPYFEAAGALPEPCPLPGPVVERLAGAFGPRLNAVLDCPSVDHDVIPGTPYTWAEVRYAARHEDVQHLEDLLLRRVRVGFVLRDGGEPLLPRVRAVAQHALGWSDARWAAEERAYLTTWRTSYAVPDPNDVPDWRIVLARREAELTR